MRLGKCSLPSMFLRCFFAVRPSRRARNTSVRVTPTEKGEPHESGSSQQKTVAPVVRSGHYAQASSAGAFWPTVEPNAAFSAPALRIACLCESLNHPLMPFCVCSEA